MARAKNTYPVVTTLFANLSLSEQRIVRAVIAENPEHDIDCNGFTVTRTPGVVTLTQIMPCCFGTVEVMIVNDNPAVMVYPAQ